MTDRHATVILSSIIGTSLIILFVLTALVIKKEHPDGFATASANIEETSIEETSSYKTSTEKTVSKKEAPIAKISTETQNISSEAEDIENDIKKTEAVPENEYQTNQETVETEPNESYSKPENNFNTYDNSEQQNTTATYVLNTNPDRLKFHYPSCNDVKKIAPENYSTSDNREELISQGYTPCGHCNP